VKVPIIAIGLVAGCSALVAGIDQLIKQMVRGLAVGESHAILPGILDLTHRQNTGTAFGFLRHAPPPVILAINIAVLLLFAWLMRPFLRSRLGIVAAALVAGGALGNLVDRLLRQHVTDYLDFHVWPVFNLADACVVVGVGCLIWLIIRHESGTSTVASSESETT
jgi:signal peptidase II